MLEALRASEGLPIRQVIASAYIDGIHKNGSCEGIRAGFHPTFVMKVFQDGSVTDVTIEEWIARLPDPGVEPEAEVTHRVPQVSLSGVAASAMVEVYRNGQIRFTDYMLLYRFAEGWRIVGKVFDVES